MKRIVSSFCLVLFFAISLFAIEKPKILTPEEAFNVTTSRDAQGIHIAFTIAQGVYLYDDKIKIELLTPQSSDITSSLTRPPAESFHEYQTQRHSFKMLIPESLLASHPSALEVKVSYQGCAEMGICYQPQVKQFTFTAQNTAKTSLSEQDAIAMRLAEGNYGWILLSFFGFGLLLSLTPCVFPMIPILSSIIVSQPSVAMGTKKGFVLSLVYVLAMASAYTIAGILAALFGANLQASLQNPWVIGVFSAMFVVLALSMFGFFEIKMPNRIQNRLSKTSDEAQTQGILGIAVMGFISALIVGPCVAAPLAGALIYIGQSGDVFLGGAALFVMSLGMGVPLLVIGTTAGRYMPRPGAWMQNVTAFFGVTLLGVAIWMLSRILPSFVTMGLWMLLCLLSALFFGAIEPLANGVSGWKKLIKGFWFIVLLYGIALFVGLLSGGSNPLAPFERLTLKENTLNSVSTSKSSILHVKSLEELNTVVAKAKKPVMVDFYADWCVNCVEFERFTFQDPRVQEKLKTMELVKIDVTHNSDEDKKLQKAFGIFGPPAILFFKDAREMSDLRLVGYKNADEFLAHIEKVGQ